MLEESASPGIMLPVTEDDLELPRAQYIDTQRVLVTMGRAGVRRITHLHPVQVFVLAMMGGFFIGMGALVSILLASGVGTPGTQRLLEGFGFSAGFFFVILSEAVLFSEANVMMPASLLEERDGWSWRRSGSGCLPLPEISRGVAVWRLRARGADVWAR